MTAIPPEDPYLHLEDADAPTTRCWEDEQRRRWDRARDGFRQRHAFAARLAALVDHPGPVGAPRPAGDRLFGTYLAPGAEYPALTVRPRPAPDGPDAPDISAHAVDAPARPGVRVLLDPAVLDPAGGTTLEAWEPSWDGRLLAYQTAAGGTEDCELRVLDVDSGLVADGPVDRVRRSAVAWLADGSGFFYVRREHPRLHPGEERYHRRVRLHLLGGDFDDDPQVFGAGRPGTQHYTVRTSPDGRWLVVTASAGTDPRKDVWLADLSKHGPAAPRFVPVHEGLPARTRLSVPAGAGPHDTVLAWTDLDAGRGRLVRTTPAAPSPSTWRDVVPAEDGVVLEDWAEVSPAAGPGTVPALLVARTRHAVAELEYRPDGDRPGRTVPLPPCCLLGPLRWSDREPGEVWFSVNRFTEPPAVYRFDARTGRVAPWADARLTGPDDGGSADDTPLAQPPAAGETPAGGAGPAEADSGPGLSTRQLEFASTDGTVVRMFVIAAGYGEAPPGPRPTLVTAYGGFGVTLGPVFAAEAVAWAEAGGVYAVVGARGGGEEGEDWHRAGSGALKENTFADVDAAVAHLVATGWAQPDRIGLWGSSNGGLTAGVALTRHPERYAAVACVAPLLDMARYQRSGMGPSWVDEYGDADTADGLARLLSWSPYHHVRPGTAYPAVLLAAFGGDTRVDPGHARKMCAALQAATTGGPVLYRSEQGVGHGARSSSSRVGLLADLLAFFAEHLRLGDGPDNGGSVPEGDGAQPAKAPEPQSRGAGVAPEDRHTAPGTAPRAAPGSGG